MLSPLRRPAATPGPWVSASFILLTVAAIVVAPAAGAQGVQPTLTVSQLSPTEAIVVANVSLSVDATYTGTVTMTRVGPGTCTVSLTARVSEAMAVTIAPTEMTFGGTGGEAQFAVAVTVPPGVPPMVVQTKVRVDAVAVCPVQSMTASSEALLRVLPPWGFFATGKAGDASRTLLEATVRIGNFGANDDSFRIARIRPLSTGDLDVRVGAATLETTVLTANTEKDLRLQIPVGIAGQGATLGLSVVVASAGAAAAGLNITREVNLTWTVPAATGTDPLRELLGPPEPGGSGIPTGSVVAVVLVVAAVAATLVGARRRIRGRLPWRTRSAGGGPSGPGLREMANTPPPT